MVETGSKSLENVCTKKWLPPIKQKRTAQKNNMENELKLLQNPSIKRLCLFKSIGKTKKMKIYNIMSMAVGLF